MTGQRYIVNINLREYIAQKKLRVDKHFFDALESKLKKIVDKAMERAVRNHRYTVMPRDL